MEFKDTYINDLYSGQISYMENLRIESKEYKEKKAILKSLYNELEETLSEKEFKKIVQIYETYNSVMGDYGEVCFRDGFKHGVYLMTSVFKPDKKDEE